MTRFALDDVRIASPCASPWDDMKGDSRVRFCGGCQKNVYNLSELTREAAQALLDTTEGQLCVRIYQRPDGTVVTQDCAQSPKVAPHRVWLGARFAAAFGLLAGASMLPRTAAAEPAEVTTPVPAPMHGKWMGGAPKLNPSPTPHVPPKPRDKSKR
jgi:hypothetical protein